MFDCLIFEELKFRTYFLKINSEQLLSFIKVRILFRNVLLKLRTFISEFLTILINNLFYILKGDSLVS